MKIEKSVADLPDGKWYDWNAICKMLRNGFSREMILSLDYSETELQAVEQEMFVQI